MTGTSERFDPTVVLTAAPRRRHHAGAAVIRIGAVLLGILAASALLAPWIAPHDPQQVQLASRLLPPVWEHGGSWTYVLGTDSTGRDLLSATMYGARTSLLVGVVVVAVSGTVGTLLGLLAGYRRGWLDGVVMRVADAQVAFPTILVVILLAGFLGGGSVALLIVAISIFGWMPYARVVRASAIQLKSSGYIMAAEVGGASAIRVMGKHLMPHVYPVLMTQACLEFAQVILAESSLSYLGVGIQPPSTSWGLLIAQNQPYLAKAWWVVVIPGLTLAIAVLALNLIGSGLRVRMDPRQSASERAAKSVRRWKRLTQEQRQDELPSSVKDQDLTPEEPRPAAGAAPILSIRNLAVCFQAVDELVPAVNDVSLDLMRGEILGIVGESGSGKSVAMAAATGGLPPGAIVVGGRVLWEGKPVQGEQLSRLQGREITVINQDPAATLDPLMSVGRQLSRVLRRHHPAMSRRQAWARAAELFELMGIPEPGRRLRQYAWEFSGGMAQRVSIAIALAPEPRVLVADEPTTALDVTIQKQILERLLELRTTFGLSVVMISHDLAVLSGLCDRISVMYAGRVVETATTSQMFSAAKHPYSRGLIASSPNVAQSRARLLAIPGVPPARIDLAGCAFRARCGEAGAECETRPRLGPVKGSLDPRLVACWHA